MGAGGKMDASKVKVANIKNYRFNHWKSLEGLQVYFEVLTEYCDCLLNILFKQIPYNRLRSIQTKKTWHITVGSVKRSFVIGSVGHF